MATSSYVLVLTTYPSHTLAEKAVIQFLEAGLIACSNITSLLTSIYVWEGKITSTNEVMVFLKTQQEKLAGLEKMLSANHPYETPEFLVIPITYGSSKYLQWVDNSLK
jgi:uncharacterized protein involved in tolerance to divalent cations